MRKFTIGTIALFVLLAMALSATAAPPEHKATGGGWVYFPNTEEKITVSFTAQIDADGNVKGQMQLKDRTGIIGTFHADVTSLEIDGNEAIIGGIVTKASKPDWVGEKVTILVVDNGEGKDAGDRFLGLPFNGNIQVS